MKRILFFLILVISFNLSFSQSVRVEVSGLLNLRYIQFDSLKVLNYRTLEIKKKYYPDTTLYSSSVGIIENYQEGSIGFSKNYQNPYLDQTEITLNTISSDHVTIGLYDISGRMCTQFTQFLNSGTYKFKISAKESGFYILKAQSSKNSSSLKLIQTASGDQNSIDLISESVNDVIYKSENTKSDDSDFFNIGDTLRISGYYNNEIYGKTVVMDRNGYAIISFGIDQVCDSVDLIGEWSIVSKSFFDIYIQDEYIIPIQCKLNFINDTVVSMLRLEPFTEGDWFWGAQNILYYRKFKLFFVYNIYNLSFYDIDFVFDDYTQPNFLEDFYISKIECNILILSYSPIEDYQFLIFKNGGIE